MRRRTARGIGVGARDARVDGEGRRISCPSLSTGRVLRSSASYVALVSKNIVRSLVGWFKRTLPFARVCRVHPNVQTRVDVSMAMCAS